MVKVVVKEVGMDDERNPANLRIDPFLRKFRQAVLFAGTINECRKRTCFISRSVEKKNSLSKARARTRKQISLAMAPKKLY